MCRLEPLILTVVLRRWLVPWKAEQTWLSRGVLEVLQSLWHPKVYLFLRSDRLIRFVCQLCFPCCL